MDFTDRTELLIGADGTAALEKSGVLVCGLGGVGGAAAEAIARAGIGHIGLLDSDVYSESNMNRQIFATRKTVGLKKTEVAKERITDINPACRISVFDMFYLPENADEVDISAFDYVIDAIDTVTSKLELITRATRAGVPIISCMGTGNKLGASFEIDDVKNTLVCPLAKVMRKELKSRGITSLKTVYSKEPPLTPLTVADENGRHIPGSISYVPPVAGYMMAGEVVRGILEKQKIINIK